MSANSPDFAELDPFKIVARPEDPETDPVRIEYTVHPNPAEADDGSGLSHNRWAADLDRSDEHVNPRWEERFKVMAGTYRVSVDGTETTLTEGDETTVPPGAPHRHWNPTGRPARLQFEARPGLRGAELFETLYTLGQAGKTNDQGEPNLLQGMVIQDAYPYFYPTDLPRSVQRAMITVLAPIGRMVGYEASYSRADIDDLR